MIYNKEGKDNKIRHPERVVEASYLPLPRYQGMDCEVKMQTYI